MSIRIALFAEKSAGLQTLKLIENSSAQLQAVITSPDAGGMTSVWNYASKQGYSTIPAQEVRTAALADTLEAIGVDLILNVYSLYLVHPDILAVPKLGCFNLHPGPLPEMAGLNVPDWAIYHQHQTHGVTLHRMEAGIDTGAIAFEDRFNIAADATGLKLSLECGRRGVQLVEQLLHHANNSIPIPQREQDPSHRKYYSGSVPNDGGIDLSRGAARVVARIKAGDYRPFPSEWGHPVVLCGNKEIGLVAAAVSNMKNRIGAVTRSNNLDRVMIGCGSDSIELETIYMDGRYQPAASILAYSNCVSVSHFS